METNRIKIEIHHPEWFGAGIVADGPWEAKFIFCGIYDIRPELVEVNPPIRHPHHEYFCSTPPQCKPSLFECFVIPAALDSV